jgi:opacity protein-like surface antigen
MRFVPLRAALVAALLTAGVVHAAPSTVKPPNMNALRKRAMGMQAPGSHWELTAFNGLNLPKDLYQAGGARLGLNDGYTLGGRVAYHPSLKLGVELSYARARGALEVRSGTTGFANPAPLGDLTVQQADLGAVISQEAQANAKATGFLLLGAGATRFGSDIEGGSGDLSQTRMAWHVGIGSKIKVSDLLSLRLEGRYRSTNTDRNGDVVYRDANGNAYGFAPHWYRTKELTAGLTYRFGG